MGRVRKQKVAFWTRGMVTGRRTLPIAVTISVRPLIRRRGPPTIGSCFIDAANRVIYIVSNPSVRFFVWHRVLTDGSLSRTTYSGRWDWGEGKRGTP